MRAIRTLVMGVPIMMTTAWVGCGSEGAAGRAADDGRAADAATEGTETREVAPVGGEMGAASPSPLLDPSSATLNEMAPDRFQVRFRTSRGDFVVDVRRQWAPLGADRFYNLVRAGFFDGTRFFRVLEGFVAQFGIHGDPAVSAAWRVAAIADDPATESNTRGRITYATGGPNTRTTQLFINYRDNSSLDSRGFSPFGDVVEGMEIVDQLYADYGESAPGGPGPAQGRIQAEGNAYLEAEFPQLDYVLEARIVNESG
jgi:peptidyl-prolyl cis-trans isomerase A (cyclophilin A)